MDEKKQFGTPFQIGRPKTGGRARGTRNKLNADFIAALCEAFEEHGKEAIRIVVAEDPATFIKICVAILPKEFEITDSRLKELPDEQLDQLIIVAQRLITRGLSTDIDVGEGETAEREPAPVLLTVRKTN
jgi:hypothetical protein